MSLYTPRQTRKPGARAARMEIEFPQPITTIGLAVVSAQSVSLAKTTRPRLAGIIPRRRLFDRLDGAPGHAVIWITGPPGCGKTALAASYPEQRTRCRPSDARHAHRR